MSNPNKYKIYLSEEQRKKLKNTSRNGQAPAKKILHAQMLLLSDQEHEEGGWTLSLLVNELKTRGIVTQISRETVRKTLKKINYDLGKNNVSVFQKKI